MKINKNQLVMQSVQAKISHPKAGRSPYRMDREGQGRIIPGTGGISYNVQVGDSAFGWAGDHIEPGVSAKISADNRSSDNLGLALLACVGNEARVMSGEAKDARGVVTGLHGGINHVLIYFEQKDLEQMKPGDEILIKAYGQGLALEDYPEVKVYNLAPSFLEKLNIEESDGKLQVPVTTRVPGRLMGSGIGASSTAWGDYDITTGDEQDVKKYGLDQIRLGDIVYLEDCDNTYGREYVKGAGSIGIVVHSDCIKMGHGPGVTTLMTAKESKFEPIIDDQANIADYLNLNEEE